MMICNKVWDVDEIAVFICADEPSRKEEMRAIDLINRPWESGVPAYHCIK